MEAKYAKSAAAKLCGIFFKMTERMSLRPSCEGMPAKYKKQSSTETEKNDQTKNEFSSKSAAAKLCGIFFKMTERLSLRPSCEGLPAE